MVPTGLGMPAVATAEQLWQQQRRVCCGGLNHKRAEEALQLIIECRFRSDMRAV